MNSLSPDELDWDDPDLPQEPCVPETESDPMTIAIGIISKRGIMLAADSQATSGTFKAFDEKKTFRIPTPELPAAIAISGDITTATHFLNLLDDKARYEPGRVGFILPMLVSSALKETRKQLLSYVDDKATSDAMRTEHLRRHNVSAILAYYYANRPFLYTFSLDDGLPNKVSKGYAAIGSGSSTARALMAGGNFRDMDIEDAVNLSVYVIERCKQFNVACGGDFQHYFLDKETRDGPIKLFAREIDRRVRAVRKIEATTHEAILKEMDKGLKEADDEVIKEAQEISSRREGERHAEKKNPSKKRNRKK